MKKDYKKKRAENVKIFPKKKNEKKATLWS